MIQRGPQERRGTPPARSPFSWRTIAIRGLFRTGPRKRSVLRRKTKMLRSQACVEPRNGFNTTDILILISALRFWFLFVCLFWLSWLQGRWRDWLLFLRSEGETQDVFLVLHLFFRFKAFDLLKSLWSKMTLLRCLRMIFAWRSRICASLILFTASTMEHLHFVCSYPWFLCSSWGILLWLNLVSDRI